MRSIVSRSSMGLRSGFALAGFLVAMLAAPGSAAAYAEVYTHGPHGSYYFDDSQGTPAGTCKYGAIAYSNWTYLKSMQINAPHVLAADRNSATREHRVIAWSFKLQRSTLPNPASWQTVASSAVQKATAYEDAQAPLTPLKVKYNTEAKDPNHQGSNYVYRALVTIKWIKGGGAVEATVRLVPTYFRVVDPRFTNVTSNGWCSEISTDG